MSGLTWLCNRCAPVREVVTIGTLAPRLCEECREHEGFPRDSGDVQQAREAHRVLRESSDMKERFAAEVTLLRVNGTMGCT